MLTLLKRSWPLHALMVLIVFPASVPAESELPPTEEYTLRLEYAWWSPRPGGELQKSVAGDEGTILDLRSDLGVEVASANPLRGTLRFGGSWKFRASWIPLGYDGDVLATRDLVYGTVEVVSGQEVLTSLNGDYFTAELEWDFVERYRGFLGLLMGVKYVDLATTLESVVEERTASRVADRKRLPVPAVGVAGRFYFREGLSVEGTFSALPSREQGDVYEFLVAGRLHLSEKIAGVVGWQKVAFEGRGERDYLKLGLSKWTYGVEISL
jgi:hypothetical protein